MNELQVFNFNNSESIRSLMIEGEPFFVGKDVANVLGYSETNAMTKRIDEEDLMSAKLSGMNMNSVLINESGLYAAILGSRLSMAKKFKRWVTKEVLPSIRKTGGYNNIPKNFSDALRLAADLEEEKLMLEQKVAEYEPKISYLDTILSSNDTVTTSQIAADYGISAIALNKTLHSLGIQHKVSGQWLLYRKHMNQGYTKSHTTKIPKSSGGTKIVMNTKWTQKGRLFIYESLKECGYLPEMDQEIA